ncbi:MAG: hypothetical protein SFY56_14960 [Bacteroidota bacterium]|nr:hypothetical protein [Bacteroidota bacterium]
MKKNNLLALVLACLVFLIQGQSLQIDRDDFETVFTEHEQKIFGEVPSDIEDINNNLKSLERFKGYEKNNFKNFQETILLLSEPPKLDTLYIRNEIREIEKFAKNSRPQNYSEIFYRNQSLIRHLTFSSQFYWLRDALFYSYTKQKENKPIEISSFISETRSKEERIREEFFNGINIQNVDYGDYGYRFTSDTIDKQIIESLIKDLDRLKKVNFILLNKAYKELYEASKMYLTNKKSDIELRLTKIDQFIKEHKKVRKERNQDINEWGIQRGLPWYCGTVVILFLVTVFSRNGLRRNRFDNKNNADAGNQEHLSKVLLEVITVLLLTLTILILGLTNILKENVLGTLIGGIAAYILNRSRNMQDEQTKITKANPNGIVTKLNTDKSNENL